MRVPTSFAGCTCFGVNGDRTRRVRRFDRLVGGARRGLGATALTDPAGWRSEGRSPRGIARRDALHSTIMPTPWPRAVVFGLLSAMIALGPFYRQILGGTSPLIRPWVMYSAYGSTACDVRFVHRTPDGDRAVDRYALLTERPWYEIPIDDRRITTRAQAATMARQLCEALGAGSDLRMDARCGSDHGWQQVASREANLCP